VGRQFADGRIGLGIDFEHPLLLLHPVPVDRVVVIAHAGPLEARVVVQRPIPAVRGQFLARTVVRGIDRYAGPRRGEGDVLARRIVDLDFSERKGVQDVLD
jgi:hypothetical protein